MRLGGGGILNKIFFSLFYGTPAPSTERQHLRTFEVPVNNKLTGTVPVNNLFHKTKQKDNWGRQMIGDRLTK